MTEQPLFGGAEPARPEKGEAHVLITVKAAPNPSAHHGETVCVAGLRLHGSSGTSWIRLYPINFRALDQDVSFKKYDIVRVQVTPVDGKGGDNRVESHRPDMSTLVVERHLDPWKPRKTFLNPMITGDACRLAKDAQVDSAAQSLALVRPAAVEGMDIERHPGWTAGEQAKIDAYVNQLTLFGDEQRTALDSPRFKAWYRYRCHATRCSGHRQQILDWEFVALQRRHLNDSDDATVDALRSRFLDELCGPSREPAFYLGNQAKRRYTYSVLGCFYPKKAT